MPCLSHLSGCELIAIANLVAILLSQNQSSDEIAVLSSFFSAVSENLALLATSNLSEEADC